MIIQKKQQGLTWFSVLFYLVFGGCLIVFGTQIIMGYVEKGTLNQIVKTVVAETQQQETPVHPQEVLEHVMKSMDMSNINVSSEDIDITNPSGTPNKYDISVSHFKQIKITPSIYLMMDLSVTQKAQ